MSGRGCERVVVRDDGKVYMSIRECARLNGVSESPIFRACKEGQWVKGHKFRYADGKFVQNPLDRMLAHQKAAATRKLKIPQQFDCICLYCRTPFVSYRSDAKYCSKRCEREARQERLEREQRHGSRKKVDSYLAPADSEINEMRRQLAAFR